MLSQLNMSSARNLFTSPNPSATAFRTVLAELLYHPLLSPPVNSQRKCLADSLAPYLARHPGKRKRSITHFDGIPIAVLSGSASPVCLSADSSAASPPSVTTREVRGPRRAMCLSDYFAGLGVKKRVRFEDDSASGSEVDEPETTRPGSQTLCVEYGKPSLTMTPMEDEEQDSDEEDDWDVLV